MDLLHLGDPGERPDGHAGSIHTDVPGADHTDILDRRGRGGRGGRQFAGPFGGIQIELQHGRERQADEIWILFADQDMRGIEPGTAVRRGRTGGIGTRAVVGHAPRDAGGGGGGNGGGRRRG